MYMMRGGKKTCIGVRNYTSDTGMTTATTTTPWVRVADSVDI